MKQGPKSNFITKPWDGALFSKAEIGFKALQSGDGKITTRIKKDASIYLLIKKIQKTIQTIFTRVIFEDFQKIFHSRPIPGLYLKQFRS